MGGDAIPTGGAVENSTDLPFDMEPSKIKPSDFKLSKRTEQTLDLYIEKSNTFLGNLDNMRNEDMERRANILQAVLNTDMLEYSTSTRPPKKAE